MEWAGLDHAHNLRSKRNVKVLMGCVSSKTCLHQDPKKQKPKRKNMFVVQGIIGTGGFGKVLAVSLQHTGKWYAVKEVNKVRMIYPVKDTTPTSSPATQFKFHTGGSFEAQKRTLDDLFRVGGDV